MSKQWYHKSDMGKMNDAAMWLKGSLHVGVGGAGVARFQASANENWPMDSWVSHEAHSHLLLFYQAEDHCSTHIFIILRSTILAFAKSAVHVLISNCSLQLWMYFALWCAASEMPNLINKILKRAGNKDESTLLLVIANAPREKIGLFEFAQNGERKTVDVVVIHGLQGDAFKTWKHNNGSLWLWDFLSVDVSFTHIMTFRYDSTVTFSNSVTKVKNKALNLLNQLSSKWSAADNSSSKLIVFICHSLEGIVIKKALILAYERSFNPDYKDILDNIKAIAFLRVPHKESDSA